MPPALSVTQAPTFAHPKQATRVILYGLVADALANHVGRVRQLKDVKPEIAFPTRITTPGMRVALRNFDRDGWGRKLRLSQKRIGSMYVRVRRRNRYIPYNFYTVYSAGHDGRFNTRDDMVLRVGRSSEHFWHRTRHAFWVQKNGLGVRVFFHRWPGKNFKYKNRRVAHRLTRSRLFDFFTDQDLSRAHLGSRPTPKVGPLYTKLARGKRSPPLVLLVIRKPTQF